MVSRLHPQSDDAHLAGLVSAFQVPPTQIDAMASDRYQIYNSLEAASSVGQNQTITIEIPGCASGSYYDLSRSYILCKGTFVQGGVIPCTFDSNVSTMYGWTSRVFNRMNMSFGSTSVVEDYEYYGVSHWLHQQLTRSRSSLQANEFVEGWVEDRQNADTMNDNVVSSSLVPANGQTNAGAVDRRDYWLLGTAGSPRPVTSWKHTPLGPWSSTTCLPSDVNVRLRLTRGRNAELLYGLENGDHDFSFNLQSVQAYMFRVVMTPDADRALLAMMAKNDLLIPHQRVRMVTQSFEPSTTIMQMNAQLQGPRANKLFMFTAFEEAFSGTYESATPFRLDGRATSSNPSPGQSATEIRLRCGDVDVPLRGYETIVGGASGQMAQATGSKDIAEVYAALQALTVTNDPGISSRQYSNIQIWAFDLSIISALVQDPIKENTQVSCTVRLSSANRKRRTLGLLSYTSSVVQIANDRTISLDI